jgi:hypothetical protein
VLFAQQDTNQPGTPTRVFLAHLEGLLDEGWGFAQNRPTTTLIARQHSCGVLCLQALHQVTDRPDRKSQGVGDAGDILAFLRAYLDRLAQRHRNGMWHGKHSLLEKGYPLVHHVYCIHVQLRGKTFMSVLTAKPCVG